MKLNPWQPMTKAIDLKHLGKLGEECNELGNIELVEKHFNLIRLEGREKEKKAHLSKWHQMLK